MMKHMAQQDNLDGMVREALRERIINGELDGGHHLSELQLAKEYNVSRTPIREALCALRADGLVEMVPHRGAFVAHSSSHTKTDQLQAFTLFMGLAAKLAAEKANIEMLMDLETAFSFATDEGKISAPDYIASMESAMDMVEKVANSSTLSEAIGMVKRRMSMAEFWAYSAANRADMNTQMNLLMGALKRKKADTAEKTARQIAQMLGNAYLANRRSSAAASAAEEATAAMPFSRAKKGTGVHA